MSRVTVDLPTATTTVPPVAEANRRLAWWTAHWSELLTRYPDQFVALHGEAIVAADLDVFCLLSDLSRLGLRSPEDVDIEFVSLKRHSMNL